MHLSLSEVNDRHNAVIVKIKKKNCHQGSNYNCVQILVLMPLCELSMCTTVRNTEHINNAIYTFIINLIFFQLLLLLLLLLLLWLLWLLLLLLLLLLSLLLIFISIHLKWKILVKQSWCERSLCCYIYRDTVPWLYWV